MKDFTFQKYIQLIQALQCRGFFFLIFEKQFEVSPGKCLILRHDVDRRPENSLEMARLEKKLGISGTYYFRVVPESYDLQIMEKIAQLGHEIGYHYEDVDLVIKNEKLKINNNEDLDGVIYLAYESFCNNLEMLRKNFDIKTICMHGSPKSKYDNKLIWTKYDYRELGISGEPYFDIDFSEVLYLTDTGRRWDGDSFSVRDKVSSRKYEVCSKKMSGDEKTKRRGDKQEVSGNLQEKFRFHSTQDIINAAEAGELPEKIMITVHPQRWTDDPVLWVKEFVWQNVKNVVKYIVVKKNGFRGLEV